MSQDLIAVQREEDILPAYRGTPVEELLACHNLGRTWQSYERAQLLVGMCMDSRKIMRFPDRFAYVLRAGGANLRRSEFKVAYAISIGKLSHLALICHDDCGMVHLERRREEFIEGLANFGGWSQEAASQYFDRHAPSYEIGDPVRFVRSESQRLRRRFPKLSVAPLMYSVNEGLLYQVSEDGPDTRAEWTPPESDAANAPTPLIRTQRAV